MSAQQSTAAPKKKRFRVPHVFVILFILIIATVILSYFAPAGEYTRVTVDGRTVIDIESFRNVPNQPLSFSKLITLIPDSMVASVSVIIMLIFSVAGLEIILATKAIDSFLLSFVMRNKGKEMMIVCLVAVLYGLVGAILGWTYGFVPFIPITIAVARSLGFNALYGAGMILLPAASGWSSGVVNVYTTAVAQSIAGLPTFSGMAFRIFGFVVFMLVTIAFLIKQAPKNRIEADVEEGEAQVVSHRDLQLTPRRKMVCLWTLAGFAFLVYTTITLRWGNLHIAGIFMFMGIVGGFIYGFNPDEISELFIKGTKGIMAGALTVGIARAVMMVMEKTMLLDSLVHALGEFMKLGGSTTGVILMCLTVTLFNGLVSSANGKVVTMVPIMVPLADILGIRRQAVVLAFCYGDGFTNWFWPTAGVIVASLGAANVRYEDWMRFSWKIFLAYTAVSCVLVAIAQIIQLGPF